MVEHVTENHGVGSSILPLGTKIPKKIEDFERRANLGLHWGCSRDKDCARRANPLVCNPLICLVYWSATGLLLVCLTFPGPVPY